MSGRPKLVLASGSPRRLALLNQAGRPEEALEIEQDTVERFPNDANAHNNLSFTLLKLARYEEALASARAALKLNPALAQARAHERQALAGLSMADKWEAYLMNRPHIRHPG